MKSAIFVFSLITLVCCRDPRGDVTVIDCNPEIVSKYRGLCIGVYCFQSGPLAWISECGTSVCEPGKKFEYKRPDLSKPYPECCPLYMCRD